MNDQVWFYKLGPILIVFFHYIPYEFSCLYFSNGFDIAQFSLDPKRKDLNKKNTQVQKGKQRQYELTKTQVDR